MDNLVKQRVIGAVVLVALAVIFVPMLLEKSDNDLGPVGSNLPEQPEQTVQDRIEPLTLPEPPAEPDAAVVLDQPPTDAAAPAVPGTGEPMPMTPPVATTPVTPVPGAQEPVTTPPPTEAPAAATAMPQSAPAPVVAEPTPAAAAPPSTAPQPAPAPTPAPSAQPPTTASKPLSGWVVQLASLASKGNALALQEKLRGMGYTAFVEETKTAQGVLYRVRVGPELERTNADNLRDRLEQQMQIKGIVQRYP